MTFSWNAALLDQLTFAWEHQFIPRLEGLGDDEYLWEPVAECWSVRPGAGDGWKQERPELTFDEPDPPPFTTIAWRLAHIATVFGERSSNHFGDGAFTLDTVPWTGKAADAMEIVTAEFTRWRDGVAALGDPGLFRPCGPAERSFSEEPFLMLVLHINREFLHHAAEVALLRDLYRDSVIPAEPTTS